MNPQIHEILNSKKCIVEQESLIEELMASKISEAIREERLFKISVTCPMCMAEMEMHAEISFSNLFMGACTCKGCKRSYAVNGDRNARITRIIPEKEQKCTDSEQLRLSGT